jgi:hypothetical protein
MSDMGSIIEYTEDLASAEAPQALPAGDYLAEITGAEIGTSQTSGKSRVDVTFRIKPEDFPADYVDADSFADGKSVHFYPSAEPDKANKFRMRNFVEAIGAKLNVKKLDVNDWIGKTAIISIIPDEYEGVERERIKSVSAK